MGFSKLSAEGRRRELRILGRVLAIASLIAIGSHVSSVPFIIRWSERWLATADSSINKDPIEVIWVEDKVPEVIEEDTLTPPPAQDVVEENTPAASADQDSPPPLPTELPPPPELDLDPLPEIPLEPLSEVPPPDPINKLPIEPPPAPPVNDPLPEDVELPPGAQVNLNAESFKEIPTSDFAIATTLGVEDGLGAMGEADTPGLLPGSGSNPETSGPTGTPNLRQRVPVEARPEPTEIARAGSRRVQCAPCSLPDYPMAAREARQEGNPVVKVSFDAEGRVTQASLETSSGSSALDEAAVAEARRNWRFNDPANLGGEVSVEVAFVLDGSRRSQVVKSRGSREAIELPMNAGESSFN
ncbi:MAG: energy transducer TonB [Cyanobacteria bacterium P01_H01_bin.15]